MDRAALVLRKELATRLGEDKVLGPDAPPVSKIQYRYIRRIIVKLPLALTVDKSRAMLSEALDNTLAGNDVNGITLTFDPDPQ